MPIRIHMETANKMHLLVAEKAWQVATQYFVERRIQFHMCYGFTPTNERVVIFTVEADSFEALSDFNDMILEVQGYLASYDVTPFIQVQP